MIKTTSAEKDKNLCEAEFYNKSFYFSYSSLNKLLYAPNIFYNEYILQEKEIKTEKHLLEGTLTHFLLLEGNNFDDNFLVLPESLPSDNAVKALNEVFKIYEDKVNEDPSNEILKLSDFEDEILEVLKAMNYYQNLKQETQLNKIIEPKSEAYFEFLKQKDKKEIIDSDMLDKCSRRVEIIKTNKDIMDLLGMNRVPDGKTFGVYNELPLQMAYDGLPFGIKGIVDNVTIDVKEKKITINDFKTSGKSLSDFSDTVEYWNYWLQAAIYLKLVAEFFKDVMSKVDDKWSIKFNFIVFDKNDHLYAFPVSEETEDAWLKKCFSVLTKAAYHYESRDYTLPYDFAMRNVHL
jgi:hypothetical protein